MSRQRNETLQALCREYLSRLRYMAEKRGLTCWRQYEKRQVSKSSSKRIDV